MARVIFINRFYFPDEVATAQLLTDLAERLAQDGREIIVVASRPMSSAAVAAARHRGVLIHRVRTPHWGRRNLFGRLVDFAAFYGGAIWRVSKIARAGDTLVVMTDPPLLGVAIAAIARWRRATLVHWVQDIYPEIAAELFGPRWLLGLRPIRNWAWRRARYCVVPGDDMACALIQANVAPTSIVVSANWAPAGLQPPASADVAALREQWSLTGKFVLGYSGNLGRVHDLAPILDLAEALRHRPEFAIVFIGQGAQRAAIEAEARARRLDTVQFRPTQKREHMAVSLAVPDVHLVTLRPGAERYVFPSKLYGAAAVGRPVVVIGRQPAEIASLVERHELGRAFTRDQIPAMSEWLQFVSAHAEVRRHMEQQALRFSHGGFAQAVSVWQSLLAAIHGTSTGAPAPHAT